MAKIVDRYRAAIKEYWLLEDNVRSPSMDAFIRLLEQGVRNGRELSHSDVCRIWSAVPKMQATGVVMRIMLFYDSLSEALREVGIANENGTLDDHIAALYSLDEEHVKENEFLKSKILEMEAQLSECMNEIRILNKEKAMQREDLQNQINGLKVELRNERADRTADNDKWKAIPEIAARVDFVRGCILASVLNLDWVKSQYAEEVASYGFYYPDLFKLARKDEKLKDAIYTEAKKQFGFEASDWDLLSIKFYRRRDCIHDIKESADYARRLVAFLPEDFVDGHNYEIVMQLIDKVEEREQARKQRKS